MQLCKLLKIPNRSTLKQIVTHKDYLDWLRFWATDPWGEDRADLRSAIAACASLAPWSGKGRTPRPVSFMPYVKAGAEVVARQSDEQIKEMATMIADRWNPEGNK